MRNPSWCTPEQSLHHLCKQSTYCLLSGTNQVLGKCVPSLLPSQSETHSKKRGKARGEERTPETLADSLPKQVRTCPRHFHVAFGESSIPCPVNCGGLTRAYPPSERRQPMLLSFFLKMRVRGAELPRKYSPYHFFIPPSAPLPFIFVSGCLWFEYRNPNTFKWQLLWH